MSAELDLSRLAPGAWFVRSGRFSRGVWPVTPEGRRLVGRYMLLLLAALAAGIVLALATGAYAWLGLSLAGIFAAALWFAHVSGRHLDRRLRYRDLKVKS